MGCESEQIRLAGCVTPYENFVSVSGIRSLARRLIRCPNGGALSRDDRG
jgi:hypothetical protein